MNHIKDKVAVMSYKEGKETALKREKCIIAPTKTKLLNFIITVLH